MTPKGLIGYIAGVILLVGAVGLGLEGEAFFRTGVALGGGAQHGGGDVGLEHERRQVAADVAGRDLEDGIPGVVSRGHSRSPRVVSRPRK